jgi:ankyrin repeat protein
MSTLLKCASRNDVVNLQKLLAKGADLKATTFDGETILHIAALRGSLDVVQFCIDQKLDLNAQTKYFGVPFLFMKPLYSTQSRKVMKKSSRPLSVLVQM